MFRAEFQAALERDQNSSSILSTYQTDDLIEKLKLLNYESLVIGSKPAINRYYFLNKKNAGEQFYMFTTICAWLFREAGKSFDQPQEFEDPNVLISKIMKYLHEMDIPTDFQSNKLIQGSSPICFYILHCLATTVLKIKDTKLKKINIIADENISLDILEHESEVILEKVDLQNALDSGDDEDLNSIYDFNINERKMRNSKFMSKDYKVDSLVDNENWRLEMERVLPQLKVVVKNDPRDWRFHLEQIKSLRSNIDSVADEAQTHLKKLQNDIVFVMDKIDSRERHLNNDLKDLILEYKDLSIEVSKANNEIKDKEREKANLEEELVKLTNELENVKIQMEQRGNSMTDGSPLINIKKAVMRLKEEISDMDVKIGVKNQTITNELIKRSAQFNEFDLMGGN